MKKYQGYIAYFLYVSISCLIFVTTIFPALQKEFGNEDFISRIAYAISIVVFLLLWLCVPPFVFFWFYSKKQDEKKGEMRAEEDEKNSENLSDFIRSLSEKYSFKIFQQHKGYFETEFALNEFDDYTHNNLTKAIIGAVTLGKSYENNAIIYEFLKNFLKEMIKVSENFSKNEQWEKLRESRKDMEDFMALCKKCGFGFKDWEQKDSIPKISYANI